MKSPLCKSLVAVGIALSALAAHAQELKIGYVNSDRVLREAGSYGELLRIAIPAAALDEASRTGAFVVRLEVSDALPGGLAIYGARFGRYPLDPTVALVLREGGSASAR